MDSRPHVLIVEDDPGVARLVGNAVEELGCTWHAVDTGLEALEWCAENPTQLILLDNVLPDMSAAELLDYADEKGLTLGPFIVTTGQGSEVLAVDLMKRGAVDYLVKDAEFLDRLKPAVKRAFEVIRKGQRLDEVEASLRQYEIEVQAILDLAPNGILSFDGTGTIVTANRATCYIFGYSEKQLIGAHISKLLPDRNGMPIFALPGRSPTKNVREQLRRPHEFEGRRADGTAFDGEVTFSEVEGSSKRLYIGAVRDITEQKQVERQLLHDAFHDRLTDLPNRALVVDRVNHALLRRVDHPGWRCGVLFVDLDRFKKVNDSMGHAAGDDLLLEAGRRMAACVRPEDTVGRLGGDEFIVLIEDVSDLRNAMHVAERILQAFSTPIVVGGNPMHVTASVGIALSVESVDSGEELLRRADIAMYRAKENGRNRFEIFDDEMHSRTIMLVRMENDLRLAIDNHEFTLHYQPIVDLVKKSVIGFEALVRWAQPGAELVPPGDFIPVAEETGLIREIGRQVLREACAQNRKWLDLTGRPSVMSVNLSAQQLRQDDMAGQVRDALNDVGLSPKSLKLELTESVFFDYTRGELKVLDELAAMGVGLEIDDFGTGYSSFAYLGKLPVEALKMDRTFIDGLPHNPEHVAITRAILAMAGAMNLNVIAEGVENADQLEFLLKHGCGMAQGFYFSRPLAAEHAEALLHKTVDLARK